MTVSALKTDGKIVAEGVSRDVRRIRLSPVVDFNHRPVTFVTSEGWSNSTIQAAG
jgi:hypothetical protein